MTRPGAFRSYKTLALVAGVLCLSLAASITLIGLLAYSLYYHPRIGVVALVALLGVIVWLKLELKKGDKWLMDHPQYDGMDYGYTPAKKED